MLQYWLTFVRIIRWPNLLFIFLTQLLFEYCVILPALRGTGITPQLGVIDFSMITCTYLLLAAAGYIINDYFDLSIDVINKPDKVFIGNGISKKGALSLYVGMNLMAIALAVVTGIRQHSPALIVCVALSALLLFCYSAIFKKRFLIGNLLVAVITASAIPILILAEPAFEQMLSNQSIPIFKFIVNATLAYTCFAVVISFARELIKDLEDVKGDIMYGGRTIPIVLGTKVAHTIASVSLLGVIGMLFVILPELWMNDKPVSIILIVYSVLLIISPLLWIIYKVFSSDSPEDYHRLSTYIKGVMLTGILSMPLIQYLFA
ncbi:geranylgeranylglycerol-phosphate geranylgeranyltransferase [Chitinophaga silvatica]|nr:geranylgeranylglycerol-phosphate geranylgeranyltransferase [Chitinophaga silvatica]